MVPEIVILILFLYLLLRTTIINKEISEQELNFFLTLYSLSMIILFILLIVKQ